MWSFLENDPDSLANDYANLVQFMGSGIYRARGRLNRCSIIRCSK
jgi:hypothetical protein